jgi:hypothetical protein
LPPSSSPSNQIPPHSSPPVSNKTSRQPTTPTTPPLNASKQPPKPSKILKGKLKPRRKTTEKSQQHPQKPKRKTSKTQINSISTKTFYSYMNETVPNTFLPAMLVVGAALLVISNTELVGINNNLGSIGLLLIFLSIGLFLLINKELILYR